MPHFVHLLAVAQREKMEGNKEITELCPSLLLNDAEVSRSESGIPDSRDAPAHAPTQPVPDMFDPPFIVTDAHRAAGCEAVERALVEAASKPPGCVSTLLHKVTCVSAIQNSLPGARRRAKVLMQLAVSTNAIAEAGLAFMTGLDTHASWYHYEAICCKLTWQDTQVPPPPGTDCRPGSTRAQGASSVLMILFSALYLVIYGFQFLKWTCTGRFAYRPEEYEDPFEAGIDSSDKRARLEARLTTKEIEMSKTLADVMFSVPWLVANSWLLVYGNGTFTKSEGSFGVSAKWIKGMNLALSIKSTTLSLRNAYINRSLITDYEPLRRQVGFLIVPLLYTFSNIFALCVAGMARSKSEMKVGWCTVVATGTLCGYAACRVHDFAVYGKQRKLATKAPWIALVACSNLLIFFTEAVLNDTTYVLGLVLMCCSFGSYGVQSRAAAVQGEPFRELRRRVLRTKLCSGDSSIFRPLRFLGLVLRLTMLSIAGSFIYYIPYMINYSGTIDAWSKCVYKQWPANSTAVQP